MNSPNNPPTAQQKPKLKVSFKVHVARRQRRVRLVEGEAPPPVAPTPVGRTPRVSRLLALAHHIQHMLDRGQVQSLAEVAELSHVTRARVTQIMNMLLLAPDIQQEVLFLPRTTHGHDPVTERHLRQLLQSPSFAKQRTMWAHLVSRVK